MYKDVDPYSNLELIGPCNNNMIRQENIIHIVSLGGNILSASKRKVRIKVLDTFFFVT